MNQCNCDGSCVNGGTCKIEEEDMVEVNWFWCDTVAGALFVLMVVSALCGVFQ